MNKRGIITIAACVGFLALLAGGTFVSRHRANSMADSIMESTFQDRWFRGKTRPILFLEGKWQPCWFIQYEMDHPTAIVDFGPQFLISWAGEIIMMSPADLKERIKKNTKTVERSEYRK